MANNHPDPPKRIKTILPVELRMRDAKTKEILGKKQFEQFVFYLTPGKMRELEDRARSEHISLDTALLEHFERHVNKLEYTQFTIERIKRQYPEIAHLYIVVDVRLIGKVTWVS